LIPAVLPRQGGLLDWVNDTSPCPPEREDNQTGTVWDVRDFFGDSITKKQKNTLRIGYQNIGGFSFTSNSIKDDIIRQGINAFEFDIFGLSETNVDWRLIPDQHKLYFRMKPWWEMSHISLAYNIAIPPVARKQFGGTALFSIGTSAHRAVARGIDNSLLGRWCWTMYKGKNNQTLKVYSAYRPNPPSGPFSVYAQHRQFFATRSSDICPRQAFLDDLSQDIQKSMDDGHHLVILLDGNDDMRASATSSALTHLTL
jgi:hypothetical protein